MRNKNKLFAIILALILVFSAVACSKTETPADSDDSTKSEQSTETKKPNVVATTTFVKDMVNRFAGEWVNIELIVPAGGDPHTYEPTPDDRQKFDRADLILYHGLHFEAQMVDIFESKEEICGELAENFDKDGLIYLDGIVDPHFWFDINLYRQAVLVVEENLKELLPEHSEQISANVKNYMAELDELEQYVTAKIQEIPKEQRYLITPHDAFSYFARLNDIKVHAPQGVSTESEVGVSDITETVDFIVDHKVKAIFAESTTDPAKMEKLKEGVKRQGVDIVVVKDDGKSGESLYSDSLGAEGEIADTYISMYKHNVDLMNKYLK